MGGVVSILAQIATIEREMLIPTSGSAILAYDNIPVTISAAQMPCFVNFPGMLLSNILEGSDEVGREFIETRNFTLHLYHSPFGTGANEEKSGLLTPYFELAYITFGAYPHLKAHPEIVDASLVSDTGTQLIEFAGTMYYGIKFTLRVTRRVRRGLAKTD